ncbi:Regulator of rDNA transcription protein 5 [Frankliniella fusca]|uniref:Regulator of rDNA transcription protein 5 n=1 Tax=Frankliniella fusca TaxID=407009 RepID=A0AAE1LUG6_9NEOP|nr:Regulator of rDNA transcription protein 5 [Frankliniella fusca]
MELHGHWQAALIELHYPNTIAHIVQGDNDITLVSDSYIDTVSARPGSFSSTKDFLVGIGDALKSFGNNNVLDTQPFTLLPDQRIKFMPFDVDEKTKVHFSPRLALQLGLVHAGPYPANEEILGVKPVDISLGIPSQMFIYMDVLEEQIIGHTRAPLLRTVPRGHQGTVRLHDRRALRSSNLFRSSDEII